MTKVASLLLAVIACCSSNVAANSDLDQILNGNTVPKASDENSFVEWMRGVEKEIGQRKSNHVIGFIFTAGLGTAVDLAQESHWPDECDSGAAGFCPRSDWERELIFLFGRQPERVEEIVALWCEDPVRSGRIVHLVSSSRHKYFCEVNGSAIAAFIQYPAMYKWWAVEPADLGGDYSRFASSFRANGFRSSGALRAEAESQRLYEQQQAEEMRQQEAARLEQKRLIDVPKMRQIGSRICQRSQSDSSIRFVGYTEGVSPDNGKIQVRVSEAQVINAPSLRPSGFQPSIIWDDPMNWDLCE